MNRSGIAVIVLIVFFQSAVLLNAKESKEAVKVMILPLEVSQQGQYSYLKTSVRQMLVSRLARQDGIEIVDYESADKEINTFRAALNSGDLAGTLSRTGTDWLVDGKLYSMKTGLQVNLSVYSAEPGVNPGLYTLSAETPEQIMPAMGALVGDIAAGLLGTGSEDAVLSVAESGSSGLEGFQTPHPERDYKKGLYGGAGLFGGDKDGLFTSRGIRKSSDLPLVLETMALGDLDGDGTNELVVASRSKIRLFSFEQSRFKEIAGYDFSPYVKIHAVNIADHDKTGQNRVYVSANEGKKPASAVLAWSGTEDLEVLTDKIKWYIRPVELPEKGIILAGQKDSPNISDRFLAPGVFEISLDPLSSEVVKGAKLLLPEKVNLFDFVIADLNGDNVPETVVIDERQKLLIYDDVLNLIWVSSANYGGSNRFFGPAPSTDSNLDPMAYDESEGARRQLVFIPGRMDVKDVTGDGLPEIVVNSNEVSTVSEYFVNFRGYDGGSVACLSWRGAGLMELWRTNHIEGYVADYFFEGEGEIAGDENNLYMSRLFVAQVPDATFWDKFIPGGNHSKMLAYEMVVKKEVKE